ncbi:MAG: ATP-binding cassette domain-containing protein, partial [Campylobacter hyointestinalis]
MIKLQNIKKKFITGGVETEVLKGINLSINRGEFVAIIGQSGSGKSTLMNILGCLDTPSSGKYLL